jgi:hypothetical protein
LDDAEADFGWLTQNDIRRQKAQGIAKSEFLEVPISIFVKETYAPTGC